MFIYQEAEAAAAAKHNLQQHRNLNFFLVEKKNPLKV
jgi:hypothetical protein